jgi:hypothetical protein
VCSPFLNLDLAREHRFQVRPVEIRVLDGITENVPDELAPTVVALFLPGGGSIRVTAYSTPAVPRTSTKTPTHNHPYSCNGVHTIEAAAA